MAYNTPSLKPLAFAAILACAPTAWAACDYYISPTAPPNNYVAILSAGTCEPQYTTYYGNGFSLNNGNNVNIGGPVFAANAGAKITITQDTQATNTRGGGTGGAFYAVLGASGNPAVITSLPNVTLTADTGLSSNTHGFRASHFGEVNIHGNAVGTVRSNQGRVMLAEVDGSITVDGTTHLTVADTAGQNSRALSLEGDYNATSLTAKIELKGDVTATLRNDSARGVNARAGTLIVGGHFTIDGYSGKATNDAIQTGAGPLDLQFNTFTFNDPGPVGIFMAGNGSDGQPTTITATGQGEINSDRDGFIAIRAQDPEGTITLGPGSQFNMLGANAVGVELGAGATFAAGAGLTIEADAAVFDSQTAFNFMGANQPIVLGNANIQTRTLWRSTDVVTDETFTANGGYYRGVADIQSGTLMLNLDQATRWDMIDDATLGTTGSVALAGSAVLDASIKGGLVTLTGDVANNGGIVTLQQTAASPADTLRAGQYTANGGQLRLDTTLNDGATSESDILRVAAVVAGTAPTAIQVRPTAASLGALTTGQGILLVEVSGGALASVPGAFTLAAPVSHNGYLYELVRDDGNGNWYLRSRAAPQSGSNPVPVPVGAPWMLGMLAALLASLGFGQRRRR